MSRKRVVIAGLGDTGVLTAIRLARRFEVVGVSSQPGLVSGQELGVRITRPAEWSRDYWTSFERFRGLDRVRSIQARITGLDLKARTIGGERFDGSPLTEHFDALVISTGVTNGFWRQPALRSADAVAADLHDVHHRLAQARNVIVVGGGAAAISAAVNIATHWPDKKVDIYFPHQRALRTHHQKVWTTLHRRMIQLGVGIHPGHRADAGDESASLTAGPVRWSTGQPPASADVVLWAIGRVLPNTAWLPPELLDEKGFVRVHSDLSVPGQYGIFSIGDVAATDPLRSSARNRADGLLARNIRAHFDGGDLRSYRPAERRWGSVIGVQKNGLEVFTPAGRSIRFPAWSIDRVLQPWIVKRGIYRGVRS